MVGDPYGTPAGTLALRAQVAHIRLGSSWGGTFGMFGFYLRFALVDFDLVSDSIWCKGVGVGVRARGGRNWPGGDYLRGALGWEKWANLRTSNKARSHKRTQAQATQPPHRGLPFRILTAFEQPASSPFLGTVHVQQPARTGMVRPDQELLSLEVWAEKKTCPDHGQAFSVGRGISFLGRDEAPAVVADREDALVWLLLQEGTADFDGARVVIQDEETLTSGERQNRGRRQALLEVLKGRELGGIQGRDLVLEILGGALGQGLGDVRVILDKTPVHLTHAQDALELRLVTRGKRLRQALDSLLVHQQLTWTDDMPQVLDLLLEQLALGGLEGDTGLFQQEKDFMEVPDVLAYGPGEDDHVVQVH